MLVAVVKLCAEHTPCAQLCLQSCVFQNAILRFHRTTFQGKRIKVEAIRDHPKKGRVKVPERLVAYVVGTVKKTPQKGRTNTMRRIARHLVSY